jgi:hypothetical protein
VNEIMTKAKDAGLMFWQSLTDEERRLILFYGVYLGASAWSMARGRARRLERQALRDEILEELRGA